MKKQNTFDANVLLSMISLLFVLPFVGVSFLFSGVQDRPENKNEKGKLVSTGPDIILYNARVRTMDSSKPSAEAIAIKGNLLQAVGTDAEIRALQTTNTQMIDLGGRAVVPGLIDNHSHRLCNAFWNDGPEGLVRAAKEAAEEGYTTVHELYGDPGFVDAVAALVPENRLAVRINCYVPYNTNAGEDLTDWKHFPYTEKKDTLLRVVGIKVFADGGSVGWPALTTLYPNGEAAGTHGNLFKTEDQMDSAVAEILRAGYPIAMHAIGDSAIGVGLHAYSNAFAGQGNALRSRIEHLHVMRADLLTRWRRWAWLPQSSTHLRIPIPVGGNVSHLLSLNGFMPGEEWQTGGSSLQVEMTIPSACHHMQCSASAIWQRERCSGPMSCRTGWTGISLLSRKAFEA